MPDEPRDDAVLVGAQRTGARQCSLRTRRAPSPAVAPALRADLGGGRPFAAPYGPGGGSDRRRQPGSRPGGGPLTTEHHVATRPGWRLARRRPPLSCRPGALGPEPGEGPLACVPDPSLRSREQGALERVTGDQRPRTGHVGRRYRPTRALPCPFLLPPLRLLDPAADLGECDRGLVPSRARRRGALGRHGPTLGRTLSRVRRSARLALTRRPCPLVLALAWPAASAAPLARAREERHHHEEDEEQDAEDRVQVEAQAPSSSPAARAMLPRMLVSDRMFSSW